MVSRASLNFKTVVIGALILVELAIAIVQVIGLLECKQCLLYGKIFEVKRTLEGGFAGWCLMVIANGLISVLICILILARRSEFGIHSKSLSRTRTPWILFCVTFSNILTACFVIGGWRQFCSTFTVARCHLTSALNLIDWRTYTPKYSRCSNSYIYYTVFQIGLLWCSVSWILLLIVYRRNRS